MSRVRALVEACHPEPTAAVTAIATALAVAAGRGAGSLAVAAAFLTGQLSVGWSNDWVDAARDLAVGRSDKPVVSGGLPVPVVRAAALTAAGLCVPLSLLMGVRAGVLHLLAVASAWSYNLLLKRTALSFLPYALSFGAVPSIVVLGLPGAPLAPAWASAAGALLGVGAHLANALPDLDDDAATGVRGLPHRLGRRALSALAVGLLLVATGLLTYGPGSAGLLTAGRGSARLLAHGPGSAGLVPALALPVAAAVAVAGLVLGRRPGSRAPFLAVLVVAAVDVTLLVARGSSLT